MQSRILHNHWFLVVLVSFALGGCATADTKLSDAALSGDPNAMFEEGRKLNDRGAELVKRGDARLNEGRKQVREGEAKIQNGNDMVSKARFDYKDVARSGGAAITPKAVADEAKQLKKIGNRWEDGIDMIRDGNKLVDKGNKTIDKAQSEIREGRMLMERGSALVRNSERIRLGEDPLPVPNAPVR